MVIFQWPLLAMTAKEEEQLSLPGEIEFVNILYRIIYIIFLGEGSVTVCKICEAK